MSHGDEHEYDHVEIDPDNPFRIDWTMNIDQVQNAYYAQLKEWEQSDCRAHLLDIVDRSAASRRWHFDKVVFFATGSFCQKSLEDRTRSMFQFICAVDLARELQKRGYSESGKVEVLAQDPAYTEVDGELMHRLGVTKLEISMQDKRHDDLKTANDRQVSKLQCFSWSACWTPPKRWHDMDTLADFTFLRTMGVKVVESTYNDELQKVNGHLGPGTMLFEWGIEHGEQFATQIYEPTIGLWICSGTRFLRECPVRQLDGEPDPECAKFFLELADEFDAEHDACDFPQWHEEDNPFGQVIHWAKQH